MTRRALALNCLAAVLLLGGCSGDDREQTGPHQLYMRLQGPLLESPQVQEWPSLPGAGAALTLWELVGALRLAREDEQITSVLIDLEQALLYSLPSIEALGQAIEMFREQSGKPVSVRATIYDQYSYLLASYANHIQLTEGGGVIFQGLSGRRLFAGKLLDQIGIKAYVFRQEDYKSAADPLLYSSMRPGDREARTVLIDQTWALLLQQIASNRNLSLQAVRDYATNLPQLLEGAEDSGSLAVQYGLADELIPPEAGSRSTGDIAQRSAADYLHNHSSFYSENGTERLILVIPIEGTLISGASQPGTVDAKGIIEQLEEAEDDPRVRAIIFRINSPGGDIFASEALRARIAALPERIQTFTSMGDTAASGGYWIALGTDEIWASAGTVTGSIGVFGLFISARDLLDRLGLYSDGPSNSPLALNPITEGLSPQMQAILRLNVKHYYQRFLRLVSERRGLPLERVREIARGRVWTGADAHQRQLVDTLGGLHELIAALRQREGLEQAQVQFRVRRLSWLQQWIKALENPNALLVQQPFGTLMPLLQSDWQRPSVLLWCDQCGAQLPLAALAPAQH